MGNYHIDSACSTDITDITARAECSDYTALGKAIDAKKPMPPAKRDKVEIALIVCAVTSAIVIGIWSVL